MFFKLPQGVGAVSVAGQTVAADENGVIEVRDPTPEVTFELVSVIGAVAITAEEEKAALDEAAERDRLIEELGKHGVRVDRRRRQPLTFLADLLEDAEGAAAADAAAEAERQAAEARAAAAKAVAEEAATETQRLAALEEAVAKKAAEGAGDQPAATDAATEVPTAAAKAPAGKKPGGK